MSLAAGAGAHFDVRPFVQNLIAIPDPLGRLAAVALADAPAQRVVGEGDLVAAGQGHRRQAAGAAPRVAPLLAGGRGFLNEVALLVVAVARAVRFAQLAAGRVAPVVARGRAEQVAHGVGQAHVFAPVGVAGPGERAEGVVLVARRACLGFSTAQ